MVLMTMIARVSDGLPLAASVQDDQQVQYIYIFINLLLLINQLIIDNLMDRSVEVFSNIKIRRKCYSEN
jgi:hypothetical protein